MPPNGGGCKASDAATSSLSAAIASDQPGEVKGAAAPPDPYAQDADEPGRSAPMNQAICIPIGKVCCKKKDIESGNTESSTSASV